MVTAKLMKEIENSLSNYPKSRLLFREREREKGGEGETGGKGRNGKERKGKKKSYLEF